MGFSSSAEPASFALATTPPEDQEWTRITANLRAVFEADALEDSINHPAEQIIGKVLRSDEDHCVLEWLRMLSSDAESPSFAASVLRCLGRQASPGTASWRAGLVRSGLSMENVEMRDAAVQAIESWGERDLIDVLRTHHEPEPWLRKYIQDVIDDLGAGKRASPPPASPTISGWK